ncbi:hypothetical protein CC80DRAFT_552151 [Byssothecium circinans]|uniref:Dynamin N-terminal domain-containing protein n=1 Tax=Byssothecium circinans TaxID=147558 RepID=A0A6A5TKE2_9PLEO|nr:hypothetical protein CC80DRAFT_552151 [Byssothecium circinans]
MADPTQVLTFAEYKSQHGSEQKQRGSKRPKCAKAYNPALEPTPNHPWFDLHRTEKDQEVRDIVDMVVGIAQNARPEDKELASLLKLGNELREILIAASSEVATVGQQGMGKSLMVNALTNRRNLSKTSARGGACTASAIKYGLKPGVSDTEESYDASVQFMDDNCLKEIITEHARRYHHFHFGTVDPDCQFEEERAAHTAEDFFSLVFNAKNDHEAKTTLKGLLSHNSMAGEDFVGAVLSEAHERIGETAADGNRAIKFEGIGIESLMKQVEQYVSDVKDFSSLWPLVDNVTILTSSVLARNGVVLVDLPGLGDLNQSRTAATNTVRRKAQFEIIAAKSERVTTEEVVDQQIKQSIRAHGAKNTILVLTKIDEYFLDVHSVETEIQESQAHPFPLIKDYIQETDEVIASLEIDPYIDDAGDQVDLLYLYQEHLTRIAQYAFIRARAADMEKEMRTKYLSEDPNPIHVFSISASMYLDWLKERQKQRPFLTPEMTGVPALRTFLLSLTAENNYQAYRDHIFIKLPLLVDKVRRIAHNEKKDNAYMVTRP